MSLFSRSLGNVVGQELRVQLDAFRQRSSVDGSPHL